MAHVGMYVSSLPARDQRSGPRPGMSVVFRTVLGVSYVELAPEHHHGDDARPPGVGRLERIGQR
jgi:hypothetical protein